MRTIVSTKHLFGVLMVATLILAATPVVLGYNLLPQDRGKDVDSSGDWNNYTQSIDSATISSGQFIPKGGSGNSSFASETISFDPPANVSSVSVSIGAKAFDNTWRNFHDLNVKGDYDAVITYEPSRKFPYHMKTYNPGSHLYGCKSDCNKDTSWNLIRSYNATGGNSALRFNGTYWMATSYGGDHYLRKGQYLGNTTEVDRVDWTDRNDCGLTYNESSNVIHEYCSAGKVQDLNDGKSMSHWYCDRDTTNCSDLSRWKKQGILFKSYQIHGFYSGDFYPHEIGDKILVFMDKKDSSNDKYSIALIVLDSYNDTSPKYIGEITDPSIYGGDAKVVPSMKNPGEFWMFTEYSGSDYSGIGVRTTNILDNSSVTVKGNTDSDPSLEFSSSNSVNPSFKSDSDNNSFYGVWNETTTLTKSITPPISGLMFKLETDNSLTAAVDSIGINAQEYRPDPKFETSISGTTVTVDASSSWDNGQITSYRWDFDNDGIYGKTGKTVSHNFSQGGEYTITLRVSDGYNLTATNSQTISIGGSILLYSHPDPNISIIPTLLVSSLIGFLLLNYIYRGPSFR